MTGYYNKDTLNSNKKIRHDGMMEEKEFGNKVEINSVERYNNKKGSVVRMSLSKMVSTVIKRDMEEMNSEKTDTNRPKGIVLAIMAFMAIVIVITMINVIFSSAGKGQNNSEDINRAENLDGNNMEQMDVTEIVSNEQDINDATVEDNEMAASDTGADLSTEKNAFVDKREEQSNSEKTDVVADNSNKSNSNNNSSGSDSIRIKLEEMSKRDTRVATILKNYEKYPTHLMKDIIRNQEVIGYTLGYLTGIKKTYSDVIDISREVNNKTYGIPLLMQWDTRWGYYKYGSSTIGISGCGPTSLNMVYIALTGDMTYNPLKMAKFSTENGYVVPGVGTSWSLMIEGASRLGLTSSRLSNNETAMINALQQGHLIIASMGPGIFTDNGHFIVIRGYENGKFRVNDPFCIAHTKKAWEYMTFKNQIKALWVFYRQ